MNIFSRTLLLSAASLVLALGLSACGGGNAEPPPNDAALTGPIVTIDDSEPGATATGDVTFTFAFSANVGTSFTADDVEVTEGTKGAFAMASGGTSATLVVVPTPNSTGTVMVTVAAGTFEDASGTKNTLSASRTQGYSTVTGNGSGGSTGTCTAPNCVDFAAASVGLGAFGDDGGGFAAIDVDPLDANNKVAKLVKKLGDLTFFGAIVWTDKDAKTFTPDIVLTATSNTMTLRVFSSAAGQPIVLKVEQGVGGASNQEVQVNTTKANAWETLSFTFPNPGTYKQVDIIPDFGNTTAVDKTFYFDELTLPAAGSGGGGGGGGTGGTVLITWDETTSPVSGIGAYGDGAPSVEAAPAGADVSGNALKIARTGAQTFGGTFFTITPAIAFTADRKTITARVYSSRAGAVIKLKVEATDGSSVEVPATQAVATANTWQTLSWNLSNVDPAKSYTTIAISPDVDVPLGGAQSYWIENVTLAAASSGGGGGGGGGTGGTVLITWDETTSPVSNMGAYGDGAPSVEAATAGADVSGNALKIARTGAQTFGGTFFTITPAIPFTADRKTITARVYSSRAGAVIKLKVETNGSAVEVAATQPVAAANTWQTLSWNLSSVDPAKSYTIIAISPDVDVAIGGAQSYWVENITLAAASSGGGTGGSSASIVNWDESTSPVSNMGAYGDGAPSVEAAPSGSTGKALKIGRSGAQTFGGTFFTITPPIPFGTNQKTITARVYSSRAGAVIRFKAEATDGSSFEVAATQPVTTANTWQTLSWNLSGVDPAKSYTIIAISPDVDVAIGGAQSYWVDDITLAAASGGGGSGALTFSSGFANGLLTIEGGAFGGFAGSNFDGYFCPGTDPASCGGGGSYAPGVAAADSNFFFYVQTTSPAVGIYDGVFVFAPGVPALSVTADTPGVQITSQTTMTFSFGQNPEWFASTTKNFAVVLDLGKLYLVGGNACHLQLRKVIAPTASAATSYTVTLSSFSVVQDCATGIAPTAVATALAASPISQASFLAAGGVSEVPQGGLTTGANLSVPTGSPAVYPTTVVVKGAITFQ